MNQAPVAAAPEAQPAVPPSSRRGRSLPEQAALVGVLVALIVVFSFASDVFLTTNNLLNVMTAIAVTGIIAVPATMLLVAAQVDLSVGSGAAFCGVTLAVMEPKVGLAVAVLIAIGAGIVIGAVNGFLVNVLGVNSLITTLGTLAVFRGFTQLAADGQTVLLANFSGLGTSRPLFNIPLPVIIFVVVLALGAIIMRYTIYGRSLYAIGANSTAARLVGIRTGWVLFGTFVASGLGVALAGLILVSQLSAASPISATGLELTVITAVVLGGASLNGGQGTISGTALGLLILGVLNNGLVLLNVSTFWQDVARGSLLIVAVAFDQLRQRLRTDN